MASPSAAGQLPSSENANPRCQIDEAPREQPPINSRKTALDRGGYDCKFVERPKELEADCPICLLILREPFQVACCGNSFCRSCIERIQADKKSCPTCNEENFNMFPDKRLRRSLYAFRVCCVHQKSGCEWTGELGELDQHLNLNPELGKQLIGCEFEAVACTHCCQHFQRCHVHAHESESCPQRPFSCNYCNDYASVYEDVVSNHWPVCKCYPVPCPKKCGANPERQNIETHVNTQCPLTIVNCDFCYTGCEVQLARRDMPTHLAEGLSTHISLLTAQTQTMAGSGAQGHLAEHLPHLSLLALHNQQLTTLIIQLKESLEESQCRIERLEKEREAQAAVIDAVKEEIAELRKGQKEETKSLTSSFKASLPAMAESKSLKEEMAELRWKQEEDRASLATVHQYTGMIMTNFAKMKRNNRKWYSPPFYTHPQGYKICLGVHANGEGKGKGTHVSLYAYLMRGEFDDHLNWPFQGHVTLSILNQLEDDNHTTNTIRFTNATNDKVVGRVTKGERAPSGWGRHNFIAHSELDYNYSKNCQYLKYDCLRFRIVSIEMN